DDANKVPPFDHKGKEADRARVYKCDGKTFVNHLERYTPDAKKKMEAVISKGGAGDPTAAGALQETGMEVKQPGHGDWRRIGEQPAFQELVKSTWAATASPE